MKIYKFGGASVKNAEGVKNVAQIISRDAESSSILVVISAMGKSTNALEKIINAYFHGNAELTKLIQEFKSFHEEIIKDLFQENTPIWMNEVYNLMLELECLLDNENLHEDFDFIYDQIVVFGELISTRIVSGYLLKQGIINQWIDSRNFISTDSRHRDARVQWEDTERIVKNRLLPLSQKKLIIAQGFIGKGEKGESTTLGREGSDYSAAIFGKLLNAESVTIWKDVPGVMNADPKKFQNTKLIDNLSFNDAIELAYYGASVIHPKTIQPLKASNIPLNVRSFLDTEALGTCVSDNFSSSEITSKIHKDKQILLEISTRDYTFIAEDSLSFILSTLLENKVRMNIMQNSAIQFNCVIDDRENQHQRLIKTLKEHFNVEVKTGLQLVTLYGKGNENDKKEISAMGEILLEQNIGQVTHHLMR